MNKSERESLSKCFEKAGFDTSAANAALTDIARMRAAETSFREHFDSNWGEAFITSECFYVIISRTAESYTKKVSALSDSERDEKINTYTALTQLYKRASQQYLEIITLVKNGFSDGAFARWRSMYELSIISSFILKYGEETAESFIASSNSEDRYDWAMASGIFPETKRHVTFGDILRRCDIDTEAWTENYTVANQTVHASPQGTFGRLGAKDGTGSKSQRSDYGIAAPAIHSANTLALIASMLFSLYPEEETVESMSAAAKWLDELIELYCDTHEKIYGDDTIND